jgi:hypothetical protein
MCYYTKDECENQLKGNWGATTALFPSTAPINLGECIVKTGGSFTWNCRPVQGGGRRMKRTRKNKKSKKQTRRIRKQRR